MNNDHSRGVTIKELGNCDHVRRGDRVVEFKKAGQMFHATCPNCGQYMRWDNWTNLSEPLRAHCVVCGICLPSDQIRLQPDEADKPLPAERIQS